MTCHPYFSYHRRLPRYPPVANVNHSGPAGNRRSKFISAGFPVNACSIRCSSMRWQAPVQKIELQRLLADFAFQFGDPASLDFGGQASCVAGGSAGEVSA